MFYTYVLYSIKYDRIYIGQTNNLEVRLLEHNSGICKSTKHYIPFKMIYHEEFLTRSESMKEKRNLNLIKVEIS